MQHDGHCRRQPAAAATAPHAGQSRRAPEQLCTAAAANGSSSQPASPFSLDIARFAQIALQSRANSSEAASPAGGRGAAEAAAAAQRAKRAAAAGGGCDWNAQIEKDLHRTFPGHPVMDGTGRSALRRLLSAYARRNPSVGYCQASCLDPHPLLLAVLSGMESRCAHIMQPVSACKGRSCAPVVAWTGSLKACVTVQGMNFVAACLLLFMDEEDAFWSLAVIIEDLLPGYFSTAMVEPQVSILGPFVLSRHLPAGGCSKEALYKSLRGKCRSVAAHDS